MNDLNLKPNSKVMIKTYCFESGLWYLAKSLKEKLIKEGHSVFFFPKAKYIKDGNRFKKTYPKPKNITEFENEPIRKGTPDKTIGEQITNAVISSEPDIIISFETLMEDSRWINLIKRKAGVKIVDVPMIEWVTPKYLKSGVYKIFDEVWALNPLTLDIMKKHSNAISISWDYVDHSLFSSKEKSDDTILFYHAGTLNPHHSTKNTDKVLKAFSKFLEKEEPNAKLIFSGIIKDYNLKKIIDKHTNIEHISGVLKRYEIAKLYKEAHCILAPSSKEGLGLSFFESKACGCHLITTDAPPMNLHDTSYLCKPDGFKNDGSLVPFADLNSNQINKQILKVYEDIKNVR